MKGEFNFDRIVSTEFCVSVKDPADVETRFLIPIDKSMQKALRQMLLGTVLQLEQPEGQALVGYEFGEKYAAKESLVAPLGADELSVLRDLYQEQNWVTRAAVMQEPQRITFYVGVFHDAARRRVFGIRRAQSFKGLVKRRNGLAAMVNDTLRLLEDNVFKLDEDFDFLITSANVYVLRPVGFELIGEIKEAVLTKAKERVVEFADSIDFINFESLAEYVGKHPRAARLVAALYARGDLAHVTKARLVKAASQTHVGLEKVKGKLVPARGSELGLLELLDHRRYITSIKRGPTEAFIAASRARIPNA